MIQLVLIEPGVRWRRLEADHCVNGRTLPTAKQWGQNDDITVVTVTRRRLQ